MKSRFAKSSSADGFQLPASSGDVNKRIIVGDTLDHNNMMKSLQKSNQKELIKLGKTAVIPKVRLFHGVDVTKKRTGILGAVYYEDLEKEEKELKRKQLVTAEIGPEELMRDEDYLKIDQSKLPLEMFDDLEYAALDKSPEEWLASGCQATVPFYRDGAWVRRKVRVLDYNAETNQYLVKLPHDNSEKYIQRLNLRFDLESEEIFSKRHQAAEAAREGAKSIMRLDHFICQQSNDLIRAIVKDHIRKIHEKVIDGLAVWMPFPEQGTPLGALLRNLTADTIQWYSKAAKKTVLMSKLTNPVYKDEKIILRFNQLKLPPFPPKPKVPWSGKVPCAPYNYAERLSRLENLHYSSQSEVLSIMKWLYEHKCQVFQYYNFMDVTLSELKLPCKLDQFRKLQHEHSSKVMKQITKELRRAFMDQLLDHVQDVFDFFQSNMKAYRHGTLYKLLRVLDLKLSSILRMILLSSLDHWSKFVSEFTKTKELPANSLGRSIQPELEAPVSWRRNIKIEKRSTEYCFDIYSQRKALFQVQIVVNNDIIEMEPSLEEIQSAFTQCIDKMVSSLRTVVSVDDEIMSLLTLDKRILLNVGNGDPLFADVDLLVRQSKRDISSKIQLAMEQPAKLCKLLSQYLWLLDESNEDLIESFKGYLHPKYSDYYKQLQKLDNAILNITELCFNSEQFSLVEIFSDNAMKILIDRANYLRDEFGKLINDDARKRNNVIIQKYKSILNRIETKPINERELADLREFIETSKLTVEELKQNVAETRELLSILDYFNIPIDNEDMLLSWSTLEYPPRIELSGKEMEIVLEADKIKMMDRLAIEKERFESTIESLDKQVKAAKLLDIYNEREKNVEKVNALMDNIEKAKEKADDFNMREKVFGFVLTDYNIERFTDELNPFYKLWNMVRITIKMS